MNRLNDFLVNTDWVCDHIPVVSSITNLVNLFQKCVFLPFINKKTIDSHHYYNHINQKSFVRCFILAIPFIGNIPIKIYDFFKEKNRACFQDPLEKINQMNEKDMQELCKSIEKIDSREDYIKTWLIFAIKTEKSNHKEFNEDDFDKMASLRKKFEPFLKNDIEAGQANKEDTLLHETLKCPYLSAKTKGRAFNFILRDGHDDLRDYYGTRKEERNEYGNIKTTFEIVEWGDSLKKIFDEFSEDDKAEFFKYMGPESKFRLRQFTKIEFKQE